MIRTSAGFGVAVGAGVGVAVDFGVGVGIGVAVAAGVAVGDGVCAGVGAGVDAGVGVGVCLGGTRISPLCEFDESAVKPARPDEAVKLFEQAVRLNVKSEHVRKFWMRIF
jgi:hypothetical protein